MSDQPVPPIICDENGDIEFYGTVDAVELDVEAVDVRHGEYDFFDSLGRRLIANVIEDRVHIRLRLPAIDERDELTRRLREYISSLGPSRVGVDSPTTASLEELVRCLSIFFDVGN